jgi:hypothetical protein
MYAHHAPDRVDAPARVALQAIEARGRAMRAWCDRVRERGGRAEVEEDLDLPRLRTLYLIARAVARGGRLRR